MGIATTSLWMRKLRPRQEHRAAPGHTARARAENQAFLPAPQLPLLVEVVESQARHLTGKPFLMPVFCCLQTGSLPLRWTLTSDSHLPHSSEQSEATRGIIPAPWHHLQPGLSWLGMATALPTQLSTQLGQVAIFTQCASLHTDVSMYSHPPGPNLQAHGHSAL